MFKAEASGVKQFKQCPEMALTVCPALPDPQIVTLPSEEELRELEGEQKFTDNFDRCNTRSVTNHSILKELNEYPLSDDVKNKADDIFCRMNYHVHRKKTRKQLMFFCVYHAKRMLGLDVDHRGLGKMFGLSPGEIQRCNSLFSPLQTGFSPRKEQVSPLSFFRVYCRQINMTEDAIREAVLDMESVLQKEKSKSLLQENPQTVASGLFRYFVSIRGIEFDGEVAEVTGRSDATIQSMNKRISKIDNNLV